MSESQGNSRKRKWEATNSPKPKGPNSTRSPPKKKASNFVHKVLLVGFSEKESNEHQSLAVGNVEFVDFLSTDITHIIVKTSSLKSFKSWSPLYFGVLAGVCFVRIDWLKKSFEKQTILSEEPFLLKANSIECSFFRNRSGRISLQEILDLSASYKQMESSAIFSNNVFQKVLLLGKKSKDSRQKKSELRAILEAGGASIVGDAALQTIKDKKFGNFEEHVTAIFIMNGDKIEESGISDAFVRKMLLNRIPILYEQFITVCIRQKFFVDRDALLANAMTYWTLDHMKPLSFDEQTFQYIVEGVGEPSSSTSQAPPRRSRTKSPANCDYLAEDASHITITDFLSEIDDSNFTQPDTAEFEENEERTTSIIFADPNNISQTTMSVLSDFAIILGESESVPLFSPQPVSWVQWRSELKYCITQALARAGTDQCYQSELSVSAFEFINADLRFSAKASAVHDYICHDSISFLRHSMSENFLPRHEILSAMLYEIAMPSFGQRFESCQAIYRFIASLLKQFPPTHSGGRLYWLKVFSNIENKKQGKKVSNSPKTCFEAELESFRENIYNTFSRTGTNANLMSLLLMLLEFDLYALEGCGITVSQEASNALESVTGIRSKPVGAKINLEGIPLAYLVFFDQNGYRRRGLDETSKKILTGVINFLSQNTHDPLLVRSCIRFISVSIEAVRWYSVEILLCADTGTLPVEMSQDIKHILRYFIKHGFDETYLKRALPLDFIYPLIDSL